MLGVTATNSGQLLTPMMLGLVGASVLIGQVMVRIRLYRFLGTAGIALMLLGFWWLSQVTTRTSALEVVRDIVIVGAGLGATFPLYLQAVQNALPRQFLGVATSQIQFWRQIGGTIGTSVLGSVLASRLAASIQSQVAGLHLPPQAGRLVPSGVSNPQAVFDPSAIADELRSGRLDVGCPVLLSKVGAPVAREPPVVGRAGCNCRHRPDVTERHSGSFASTRAMVTRDRRRRT